MPLDRTQRPEFARTLWTRLLTVIALFAIAVTTSISGAGPAEAVTPDGSISHCWLNVSNPSQTASSQYTGLIQSLRNAAGGYWRNGVFATQTNTNGLIRLDLNNAGTELQLWFSPNNLYLRGFTTTEGLTFEFNDADYNLQAVMNSPRSGPDAGLLPASNGGWVVTNFGSDYNSILLRNSWGSIRDGVDLRRCSGQHGSL